MAPEIFRPSEPDASSHGNLQEDIARLAWLDSDRVAFVLLEAARLAADPEIATFARSPRAALARLIREATDYNNEVFEKHWPLIAAQLATTALPGWLPRGTRACAPSAFVTKLRVSTDECKFAVFPVENHGAAFSIPAAFPRWHQPLADLVGARRAILLAILAVPATSEGLRKQTDLSDAALQHHLKIMRRAGLIHRDKGRNAVWSLTLAGTHLLQAAAFDGREHRWPIDASPARS
jgi:DNA-binding transcriptional ArsR family regulator